MAYYRKNSYKRKYKNYSPPNRRLRLNCSKHGELTAYTEDYNPVIYEYFNDNEKKVELKCYKCLEEKCNIESNKKRKIQEKSYNETYNEFGRKAKTLEFIAGSLFYIGFFGGFFLLYMIDWIFALSISAALFIIGWRLNVKSDELQSKVATKPNFLDDCEKEAKEIVRHQKELVADWRRAQARIKKEKMSYSFEEIDKMTGTQFEIFVKNLLDRVGYENSQTTKASGDEGVDVITYKNGKKIAVQCKRYEGKISNSAIQEVFSGMHYYGCDEAYVITNSYFTDNAVNLAKKHKVKLINRNKLFDLMEKVQGTKQIEEYQTTLF